MTNWHPSFLNLVSAAKSLGLGEIEISAPRRPSLMDRNFDQVELDEAVLELFRIAKKFQGSSDGWESQVV